MENEIDEKRAAAVEELQAAFAELESGEGLTRFVGGHGVQSRVFEFEWSDPAIEMSFRIPYAGELEDSGTDWAPLVKRFEAEFGDASEPLSIIWP